MWQSELQARVHEAEEAAAREKQRVIQRSKPPSDTGAVQRRTRASRFFQKNIYIYKSHQCLSPQNPSSFSLQATSESSPSHHRSKFSPTLNCHHGERGVPSTSTSPLTCGPCTCQETGPPSSQSPTASLSSTCSFFPPSLLLTHTTHHYFLSHAA